MFIRRGLCGWWWALVLAATLGGPAPAQDAPVVPPRTSSRFLKLFVPAVADAGRATVSVRCEGRDVALGAVVGADGWVLTKASELHGTPSCVFADGVEREARVVGMHEPYDLALLKVVARGLAAVEWLDSKKVRAGDWLVTPGRDGTVAAAGVVSVATRKLSAREAGPSRPNRGAFLGAAVSEEEGSEGLKVEQVVPDGPAAQAGLRPDDYLLALDGRALVDVETLHAILQKAEAGDVTRLSVRRGDKKLELKATLKRRPSGRDSAMAAMSGKLSTRRTGFAVILQHDSILRPQDCGGPVVNLDGKAVGLNIARAGRAESYAIPSEAVLAVLDELKSGKLAPRAD